MKTKPLKKSADEEEAKSVKMRSSREKRRSGRRGRSQSPSDSDSPTRKRPKKIAKKKLTDKKSKKKKKKEKIRSSRRRRRRRRGPSPRRSTSGSPSSLSRSHSSRSCSTCCGRSSGDSDRSVSPLPQSQSRDARKGKGMSRVRERERRRRRRMWRSRSYSSHSGSSSRSQGQSRSRSKSRRRRVDGLRDEDTGDKIIQAYDDFRPSRSAKNSIKDVDGDDTTVAIVEKRSVIVKCEKNVDMEKTHSPPAKEANEKGETAPAGEVSLEAEDLELILRRKALENLRKFRGGSLSEIKTDNVNKGDDAVPHKLQDNCSTIAETRSDNPLQRQAISLGVSCAAGSPRSQEPGNGASPFEKQGSSSGMSHGAGSPRLLETGNTSSPLQLQRSSTEASHPAAQPMLQDARNSSSVMQKLGSNSGCFPSVMQRVGSSPGTSCVNKMPRIRSVVSIPTREERDDSAVINPLMAEEDSVTVENSSEVRHTPNETNKDEQTNGENTKTAEVSAFGASASASAHGKSQAKLEDNDASQFEQKTFSRMHDGETVQVSYKVYIPKKSPALARRKLQR